MPDHIGAFLKAGKCFSELGINITRVSYNKVVDSHTLFIEVDGEYAQLEKANEKLKEIGYLSNGEENSKIILLDFRLKDEPGSVTHVLELISKFAELLSECKGKSFKPRVTEHYVGENTKITLIEPDCGSNTAIIESCGERLFVDSLRPVQCRLCRFGLNIWR